MNTKRMRKLVLAACLAVAAALLMGFGASFVGKGAGKDSRVAMAATASDCTTESGLILKAVNGEYTVTGCTDSTTVIDIPDEYGGVKITAVAEDAFYDNQNITKISVGANVESIGSHAFAECFAVTEIWFGARTTGDYDSSLTAPFVDAGFDTEDGLDITIGKDVERIGDNLFLCVGHRYRTGGSLRFEKGSVCSEIGANAFGSSALAYVEVPSCVEHIGENAFGNAYAEELYFDAPSLSDYTQTTSAFYYFASGMTLDITIGKDVERIPAYCFYGAGGSGGDVVFESGSACREIGEHAFHYCGATCIEIPSFVEDIGDCAFKYCSYLQKLCFDVPSLRDYTEETSPFSHIGSSLSSNAQFVVTIGSSVTRIPEYCFCSVSSARAASTSKISWEGSSCVEIAAHAFEKSYLGTVTTASSVEKIGYRAFYGSTYLSTVTIGTGVKEIGAEAFAKCTSLYTVNFNAICCGDFAAGEDQFGFATNGSLAITVGSSVTRLPAYFAGSKSSSSSAPRRVITWNGTAVKEIGDYAFANTKPYAPAVNSTYQPVEIPSSVEHIGVNAFYGCTTNGVVFSDTENWYLSEEEDGTMTERLSPSDLADTSGAKTLLTSACAGYHWYRGDDFKYELSGDGKSYAVRKYVGLGGDAVMASSYDSLAVTAVSERAFYGVTSVTSFTIPSSVLTIGGEAFSGCASLTTLTIAGSSLETVGADAFYGCTKLTKIYADTLSSLFSVDYENAYANPVMLLSSAGGTLYIDESKTTDITAKTNSGLAYIGSYAFAYCTVFTDVELSEGLTHVGTHAFEGMDGLDSFSLGSYSGWSVYDETRILVKKITATELKTGALGYFTVTYLSCVWEHTEVTGVAPTIDCVVESGGYTNGDIVIYTTVDSESSIDRIVYVTPSGAEESVSAMTLTLCAKDLICGLYVFYAVDVNGLESEEYYITFDDEAPEIYATGSDVWGGYVGSGFSVYAKDENDLSPVTLYYSRDGESFVSCGGDSFSVTPSGDSGNDGKYWFAAVDAAGNRVGAYWIVLDTLAPDGEWKFTDDLSLYFSWDAPSYTTWTCTVNGKAYVSGTTYRDETTYTAILTSPTGNTGTVTYRLGHSYEEEYFEATCSRSAYRLYTCVYCGDWQIETDPYSSSGDHAYELIIEEPTCTEPGYSEYVCADCGAKTGYSYIAPLGHLSVAGGCTAPTCTADGYTETVCSRCGEKLTSETISRLGHDLVTEIFSAGCTESARTVTTCSRCDEYFVEELSGDALGHSYIVTEYVAPDCESAGKRVFVCEACGDTYTEELPALDHSRVTTYVKDENGDTWMYVECSRCGELLSAENLGSVEETASNGVIEIFRKYQDYMWWILLAFVAIWSIFIGLRWALARNSDEKAKSHSMLANYILGLFVIAIILVGLPYLIYGIAVLVA